ncbi:MAG: LON peptidase substrate-binding domain-containing protein, partial [Thermodesulfobacteriota bacterium]
MPMFFKNEEGKGQMETIPLLPLRDVVIFPYMVAPLFVGREKSIRALEEAMKKSKEIFLVAQRDAKTNDPQETDIHDIGTIGTIVQMLRLPDGTVKVLVEGKKRAKVLNYLPNKGYFLVEVEVIPEPQEVGVETEALIRTLVTAFENYVKLNKKIPSEVLVTVSSIEDAGRLSDTISSHLGFKLEDKQEILETLDPAERLEKLYEKIQAEVEILQIEKKIRSRVKKQMEKAQKEYYLNEKMKAIQKELGRKDEKGNEVDDLKKKIEQAKMPKDVEEKAVQELKRLEAMPPMSAEATVSRNYL